ncbi:MAG: pyridoxamine 5'-phosphate oxidase family protein [Pseudomonadales bacterium]|nr:pyridoxamine 5'-phosphate oxidase family protein [Pseudomonadales bacterium]
MSQLYDAINDELQQFILKQKIFFVGTAGAEGKVNVSPKGMDTLRVIDDKRVIWLNHTGSGNESAAHVLENGRMTIMFCAFEDKPLILRLYGNATAIHERDDLWDHMVKNFDNVTGARQIFNLEIEMVQTSCGFAVPNFDYVAEREVLLNWAEVKGREGVVQYWRDNNVESLDGKPTKVFDE